MNWQSAERAKIFLWPFLPLRVQLLVLDLCCTLLAGCLVLLAMGLLAVHAAVLDEATCRAVLELDGIAGLLAAVCTDFSWGVTHLGYGGTRKGVYLSSFAG